MARMRFRRHHAVIAGLLALLAASLMAGCTGGTVVVVATPPPPDAGFHTYRHPTGVFTLRLPPGWSVRDLSTGPTL